jgi:hypothetical protein
MINAVLNSIPIFYLSFYKLPKRVCKKIVRIQREFLWGGPEGGKRIPWVKWAVVCKDKNKGGLGVRDISLVNSSLLVKWRWRLLSPEKSLWKDILISKYGDHPLHQVEWSSFRVPTNVSSWWKNIIDLEKVVPGKKWLLENIRRKVGNGVTTHFWTTKWVSDLPLSCLFPRLFSLSNQKDCKVSDCVLLVGGNLSWNFSWRRNLFQWEENLKISLLEVLDSVVLSLEEDCWNWIPEVDGIFSVKSAYNHLVSEFRTMDEVGGILADVFERIWESPAPSKVIAFSWQLLYDRIPTRSNLGARGVVCADRPWECVGCVGKIETTNHLFLHCPCAMKIWCEIFKWIGVNIVIPSSVPSLFAILRGAARNNKIRKGFLMIWHATL